MAWRPLEQKRLMVCALDSTGKPPRRPTGARDVQALLALGHRAAEHELLDLGRLHARDAREQAGDDLAGQLVRTGLGQGPLVRTAHGRAHRIHDHDVFDQGTHG